MNTLQLIETCRNRRNKAFKDTTKKEEKKGSNKQINEEDDVDYVINEDNDRNLHNIDNDLISDGASDDASSNSQESNRSSLVDDHNDDSDDENCSFESKLQFDGVDIYDEINNLFLKFTYSFNDWMNRREYENQKLYERHPFTVQEFSEELSAILAKQIVQKGTDTKYFLCLLS